MDLTGRPKTNSFFGKSAGATLPEPAVQPTPQSSNLTTILKGMRIEGSILAQEDMYVDNEVNGPITSNSKVTVGPSATIHGEIKAREIVIMGRVIGNVEATEKVALCDGADLRGDITTFLISIEEKAVTVQVVLVVSRTSAKIAFHKPRKILTLDLDIY
jgi:cytoskeletal protein CcmA (bactofilin family)